MTEINSSTTEQPEGSREVRIAVNEQFVTVDRHQVTGEEIKAAAISQGVPIQLDFDLSEVLPNGEQKAIGNDKTVAVKEGDEFWAIPGDDNS
jgi:hypothetical protein